MAAFLAAGLIYLACLPIGAAALRACGRDAHEGYGAAVGLALLIVVTSLAIRLPGDDTTSVFVTGAFVLGCAAYARRDLLRAPHAATVLGTAAVAVAACLPFIATGEVGIQGVGINFDMSVHVAWAETLRAPDGLGEPLPLPEGTGYPLGPHAVVGTVGQVLGIHTDDAFIGFILVVPLLAFLCATSLLGGVPAGRRSIAAALVALAYLTAAYLGQGAFKETVQAAFLLGFLAVLREMALRRRLDPGGVALLALIAAGSFYNYSYLGLTWFVASIGAWVVLELALGGGWIHPAAALRSLRRVRGRALAGGVLFAVVLFAAILPELLRALDFFRQVSFSPANAGGIAADNTGNLAQALSPYEAIGVWPNEDFRTYFDSPREAYRAGLAGAVGLIGLAAGAAWWLRPRDLVLPAAGLGAFAIYLYLRARGESPYVQAKALVVLAPVATALAVGGLLAAREEARGGLRLAAGALVAAFAALAALSSFMALRGSFVGPDAHPDELASFRSEVSGGSVLFLPSDFFANYRLRGAQVSGVVIPQPVRLDTRPSKAAEPGTTLDFDWVTSATLDRFGYVVAPRTRYASEPPANFRRVRATASYELWRRSGRTPRRLILREGRDPGKVLDCTRPEGRALSRRIGWARVWGAAPSVAVGPPGRRLPRGIRQSLRPGSAIGRRLRLDAGRYQLSLVYTALRSPRVRGIDFTARPVPQIDPPGTPWGIGDLRWPGGSFALDVEAARMRLGATNQVTDVGELYAVRVDRPAALVPLGEACGRYVDWYTLGRERPPVPARAPGI